MHFPDPVDYVREDVERDGPRPTVEHGLDADVKRLKDCLAQLGSMQRNAVCLAYMNGLTHEEVADARSARRSAR